MSEAWATTFSIADVLMAAGAAGAATGVCAHCLLLDASRRVLAMAGRA